MSEVDKTSALPNEGYDELEPPDCRLPWQQREDAGVFGSYWRTAWLVMRHPGRLGGEVATYVDSDSAKAFRSMTMTCAVMSLAAFFVCACIRWSGGRGLSAGMSMLTIEPQSDGEVDSRAAVVGLVAGGVFMVLAWIFLRLALGAAKWFFVPPSMPLENQLSSRWLVQYLSAPLVLLAALVPFAAMGSAPGIAGQIGLWGGSVWMALVAAYWLVVVVLAMRAMTGFGGRKLILRGAGLLIVWIILALAVMLVPLSVPTLMLMQASLQQ